MADMQQAGTTGKAMLGATVDVDAVEAQLRAAGFEPVRFEHNGMHAVCVHDRHNNSLAIYDDGITVVTLPGPVWTFLLLAVNEATSGLAVRGLRAHADLNDWEVFRSLATFVEEGRANWDVVMAEWQERTPTNLTPAEVVDGILQLFDAFESEQGTMPVAERRGEQSCNT